MNIEEFFLLGRPVYYYPAIAKKIGVREAVLTSFLIDRERSSPELQGWFLVESESLERTIGMRAPEQQEVIWSMVKRGLIEERTNDETHWVKLNGNQLEDFMQKDAR